MPTHEPLTIVIVGGVAAGASAAARARRCHEQARIILLEKDAYVSFANCGLPYYLGGEIADRSKLLVATPAFLARRFKIEVRTHTEVTAIDRTRRVLTVLDRPSGQTAPLVYDRLILTPGATPLVPPIPGVDAANVFTLRNLEDADRLHAFLAAQHPARAVVVGAGFIGLEMVEQLRRLGLHVALVELLDQVLPPLDPEMAHLVQEELTRQGVELHLGDGIKSLRREGPKADAVELNSGAVLPADLVVLGIGVRTNTALAKAAGLELGPSGAIKVNEHLQTSDPLIYAAGDAAETVHGVTGLPARVPLAGPANRAGRLAGEHAATGHAPPMGPVLGTAIVRVFQVTAGMTGLSAKAAAKAAIPFRSVLIEARDHAGYFPGARPMILKLLYNPQDGRVLGAQAVGAAGIDKRIDVIATALQLRGTVQDLSNLDLAYAPPFGSAKDPVHMAAFAALNQMADLTDTLAPDADLAGLQVLDVRTNEEYATGHEPDTRHIPLDDLRDRLGELDAARPTVVMYHSGLRAHVAVRILRQHGFAAVRNLTGGYLMRRHARPAGISETSSLKTTKGIAP